MEKNLSRRQFLIDGTVAALSATTLGSLVGCAAPASSGSGAASTVAKPETLLFEWEPTASTAQYDSMREVFAQAIAEGAGIPCESVGTTDYNVAIESLSAGKVHYASLGASEYVEVHKKNPAVEIAWVLSNKEGELDPVSYHSQVLCLEENAIQYMKDGAYSTENVKGKNYSFVSLSSTSGFVIPATIYKNEFGLGSTDDLSESSKFFNTVTMAGSHTNCLYNVLSGDSDLCSCDDTGAANNYTVVSGANGEVGSVYEIKAGLDAPMDEHAGKRLVVIESFAVPAVPFCVNTDVVDEETRKKVVDYMCSDAVSNNPEIFIDPSDTTTVSKWKKSSDKVGFVPADDSYYDDFRKLIGD